VTRASVLIPTHDKAATLPLAVDSVLRQSVGDLEVLLIGDGVTHPLRAVIEDLVATDERVRFLDFPKGPHHGERYRHDAVRAASSEAIFYLCDDDLLLPDHVADLLVLLETADLVQSLNGYLTPEGEVRLYPGDLADAASVAAHLDPARRHNAVSITGTAHSRAFYDEVDDPWDTTPPGRWPDHHQWSKLMRHPGFRGATSARMTALQLPTSSDGRHTWTAEARLAELERWHRVVTGPDPQAVVDELVHAALRRAVVAARLEHEELSARHHAAVTALSAERDARAADVRRLEAEGRRTAAALARAERRLARKNATLAALRTRRRPADAPETEDARADSP
jgi:hypothetical protein